LYQLRSKITIFSRRKVLDVALHEHLGLLTVRRRGKRGDAENARTDALRDRLDGAALAGGVTSFEDNDDP
jgi:hypothetical protein